MTRCIDCETPCAVHNAYHSWDLECYEVWKSWADKYPTKGDGRKWEQWNLYVEQGMLAEAVNG